MALTWAKVADDLVRTAESEKKLSEVQRAVAELDQKAVRTQALIEQTIARRGRAELNLKNAAGAPTTSTAGKGESQKPAKESGKSAPTKSQVKPSQPGVKQ